MTTPTSQEIEQKRARLRSWVSSDFPQVSTQGVDHIAMFSKDLEETAAFYTNIMGMPVVNVTSNRDVPESTHMNVSVGNGMQLSFFDFPHVPRLQRRAPEGVGGVMHIALGISKERLNEVKSRLDQRRVKYQEVGGSVYLKDPNGLGIELMPMA
ncbi:MAG TPA: VOC family protein [Dehalococcoidia bacterium]|nr:VOC family protein [Dehalococcoidia bacterium]